MAALFNSVTAAFQNMGWKFREIDGHHVIEADFDAHHARIHVHVQAFPELNALSTVSQFGEFIPASHKNHACELLMRINEGLTLGNFELRWDEGTVLFRTTNLFGNDTADQKIIAGLVHSAIAEMDRMTPLLAILLQTTESELPLLDLPKLMNREDLLPPVDSNE